MPTAVPTTKPPTRISTAPTTSSPTDFPTRPPTPLSSSCHLDASEDFEDGKADGWTNFSTVSSSVSGSKVLGPFAISQQPTKTFDFPSQRKEAVVSFVFSPTGTWDGNHTRWGPDKFKVYVNNEVVDFGFFGRSHPNLSDAGTTATTFGVITWRRTYLDGIHPRDRYVLRMEVPVQSLSPKGKMTLRFFADVPLTDAESASIDDLVITGCDQNGQLPS